MKRTADNDNNNNAKRQEVVDIDEDAAEAADEEYEDDGSLVEGDLALDRGTIPRKSNAPRLLPADAHIVTLVKRAIHDCNQPKEWMLFDAVMRASNRRFALGPKDCNITTLTERVYRHIDSLPEADRSVFARRLVDEVADCNQIARTNYECMAEKIDAQRSVYASHLYAILRVCMRYELPLRFAKRLRDDLLQDENTKTSIYATITGLRLKHDKVTISGEYDMGPAFHGPAPGKHMRAFDKEIPRVSLCVLSAEGTIIKWTVNPGTTYPGSASLKGPLVLPPLVIRSLLVAERRFHWFGAMMHLIRKGEEGRRADALPPVAMRLIGMYFHKHIGVAVKKHIAKSRIAVDKGNHYYPSLTDGSYVTVNRIHAVSAFKREQQCALLKFVA
jgi:hypothetical protein